MFNFSTFFLKKYSSLCAMALSFSVLLFLTSCSNRDDSSDILSEYQEATLVSPYSVQENRTWKEDTASCCEEESKTDLTTEKNFSSSLHNDAHQHQHGQDQHDQHQHDQQNVLHSQHGHHVAKDVEVDFSNSVQKGLNISSLMQKEDSMMEIFSFTSEDLEKWKRQQLKYSKRNLHFDDKGKGTGGNEASEKIDTGSKDDSSTYESPLSIEPSYFYHIQVQEGRVVHLIELNLYYAEKGKIKSVVINLPFSQPVEDKAYFGIAWNYVDQKFSVYIEGEENFVVSEDRLDERETYSEKHFSFPNLLPYPSKGEGYYSYPLLPMRESWKELKEKPLALYSVSTSPRDAKALPMLSLEDLKAELLKAKDGSLVLLSLQLE